MSIRVAQVITRLDMGGAQETVVRICAGLDRSRFQPLILTGPDEGSGGTLHSAAADAGIPVFTVRSLRGPIRPGQDLRCTLELTDKLRRLRPDIVHTNSSKAGVVGRIAAQRARIPHVVHTIHGWSFNEFQPCVLSRAYQLIERRLGAHTDALVVVTNTDRDIGLRHRIGHRSKYVLVRSGIPLTQPTEVSRASVRASLGWADDTPVVLSVGRLEPQKDPLALIDAMSTVVRRMPSARLVVVGGGSLAATSAARAAERGIAAHVDFLGIRRDVPELLIAADVFASAARWEGMPRTVMEAVAAGVPIAVTDVGGLREVVDDGISGRLTPPTDPSRLAQAILEQLDDRAHAHAMASVARSRIAAFSEEQMVGDMAELYDRLVAPSP